MATTEPAAIEAKRAQVAELRSELEAINIQVEQAAEAYNGARYELEQATLRIDENTRKTRETEKALGVSRERLAQRLRSIYATPEPSLAEILIASGSITAAADQLDLLDRVGEQDAEVVTGLREHKEALVTLRAELVDDRATAADAVEARQRQKEKVQALLAQREAVLDDASADLRNLIEAEQEREAAAARAAAAAARARLASASSAPAATAAPEAATPAAAPEAAPAAATPLPSGSGNAAAAQIALQYIGVPYRWGGASPSTGFDCSGLASYAYAQIGKSVPHYTVAIWNSFPRVPADQLQPGDMVFYRGLGHMGIYIGGGQYVHAPQTGDVVKVSSVAGRGDYVGAVRP